MKAVDGVDLAVERGTTFGLVGESGCGKSTLGRGILRLESIHGRQRRVRRRRRRDAEGERSCGRPGDMQMIFQDPMASLNPRQNIESILTEPLARRGRQRGHATRVRELLGIVGLPHERGAAAIRTSSPVVSASASASPGRSR